MEFGGVREIRCEQTSFFSLLPSWEKRKETRCKNLFPNTYNSVLYPTCVEKDAQS